MASGTGGAAGYSARRARVEVIGLSRCLNERMVNSVVARSRTLWLVGLAVTAVALWAAIGWEQGQPPLRGRENTDLFTSQMAGAIRLLATFAGLGTVASLAAVVLPGRRPQQRGAGLDEDALDRMATTRHWAIGWTTAALALVPFDAAQTSGIAVSVAAQNLRDFLLSTQTTQAWLLTAVVAFGIASVLPFVATWRTAVALLAVSVALHLPTVVTAQVSVGADHDLATDAAIVLSLTSTLWFGAALALSALPGVRVDVLRRYQRVAGAALVVALPARALIGWFEMAGSGWLTAGYGTTVVVPLVLLLGLGVCWLLRHGLLRQGRLAAARRLLGVDALLGLLITGVAVVQSVLVPPRFRVPQTPQQNYLGYEVPDPPSLLSLVLPGRPNLLLVLVAVTMITVYLLGVRRLHRRGDRWPGGRTAAWVVGWAAIAYLGLSQVWQYASTTFSWHMVVHMGLNMGAPALLVLAGPMTLLLRTRANAQPGRLLSLRDVVTSGLSSRLLHVVGHPLLVWAVFVSSFYLLYLTGLFDVAMKYHWSHQLMNLHFLVVGSLYYQVVIGVDAPGRPLPHIAKLGYILAAMPFHAFFAVAVLNSGVIGANYYSGLDLTWAPDLAATQQVGGQLAWALGELPLLGVTIALLAQWFSSDQRAARRFDRAYNAGHDTSLDAYNEMLAELARRDRGEPAREASGPADTPPGPQDGSAAPPGAGTSGGQPSRSGGRR